MEADFKTVGIPVTIAPPSKTGLSRRHLVDWLVSRWSEHRPDVVHTHLGADVWAGFACRKLKIPQVITAHSHEPGLALPIKLLRWQAYRGAAHVVAVSDSVRRMILRQYGVSMERSSVIRIGIDLARFKPRVAHQAGDMPHLVSVGRLLEDKGHHILLEALALIKRPWTLEILGEGPERISLQRRAELLGIMPRVTFAGSVPDVPERLAHADLFLLASRHEGQAIALLEAAAAQVPALVSDLPVFHEVFPPDAMMYAPVDNVEAWVMAMNEVLNQYGKAMERAVQARKIVERSFSLQGMVSEYSQVYSSLRVVTPSAG